MSYKVDFLPVGEGSGDAIVVQYEIDNQFFIHVVDGGRTETANTITEHINKYYPNSFINHMVLSHADDDHATGLVGVMKTFEVEHLWMNRPWLYAAQILHHFHGGFTLEGLIADIKKRHPYLVELEELAEQKGTQIHEAFQGAHIGQFRVLAPTKARYVSSIADFGKTPDRYASEAAAPKPGGLGSMYENVKKWIQEKWDIETLANDAVTSASNESCVVQYAALDARGVLLTADAGPIALHEAADFAATIGLAKPKLVQVPHHGSRHNATPEVLDRWLGPRQQAGIVIGTAICSVGANKHDYPRGQVNNAFLRRGFPVFSTRTKFLSSSFGGGHPDLVSAVAGEFANEVESL